MAPTNPAAEPRTVTMNVVAMVRSHSAPTEGRKSSPPQKPDLPPRIAASPAPLPLALPLMRQALPVPIS